jgi:hypothetical protein
VLGYPGGSVLARVESVDTTWLQVRVPERARSAWHSGQSISFQSTDGGFRATGTVQAVETRAHPTEDIPNVWATVHLDTAAPAGATGIARTLRSGWL